MQSFATITIHESQWPEALTRELHDNLRRGSINHKFLYESPRQVRQWLKLHELYSPARREAEFDSTYGAAFATVRDQLGPGPVHVIGLGCGGGQKETALLHQLRSSQQHATFTATDVSTGMVVTSLRAAWAHVDPTQCAGVVCDLALATDLEGCLNIQTHRGARRVLTFFGMIPNFEPAVTQSLLGKLLRPGDLLLCSANLAPGRDYRRGVEAVLPQYDNAATRDWLNLFHIDVGIEPDAGVLQFAIREEPPGGGLLRIEATFEFSCDATASVEGETFQYTSGDRLRVFFSYRHTPETLANVLAGASLNLRQSWISSSGEEGVFLLER